MRSSGVRSTGSASCNYRAPSQDLRGTLWRDQSAREGSLEASGLRREGRREAPARGAGKRGSLLAPRRGLPERVHCGGERDPRDPDYPSYRRLRLALTPFEANRMPLVEGHQPVEIPAVSGAIMERMPEWRTVRQGAFPMRHQSTLMRSDPERSFSLRRPGNLEGLGELYPSRRFRWRQW